jgi:hypothetical protein
MIRKLDNTGYLQSPSFHQRNIAIVFDMNGTIIPPALSFRFITASVDIQPTDLMYSRNQAFTDTRGKITHDQCSVSSMYKADDDMFIFTLL